MLDDATAAAVTALVTELGGGLSAINVISALSELGVRGVGDCAFVETKDLEEGLGLKKIPARRLCARLGEIAKKGDKKKRKRPLDSAVLLPTAPVPDASDAMGEAAGTAGLGSGVATPLPFPAQIPVPLLEVIGSVKLATGDADAGIVANGGGGDVGPAAEAAIEPEVKRAKRPIGRPRKVRPPEPYNPRKGRAGKGCGCEKVLLTLEPRFHSALRSEREVASLRTLNKQVEPSRYNYARLCPIAVEALFDATGKWLFHRSCASRVLKITLSWLGRAHARAIDLAKTPTETLPSSAVDASDQTVLARLILPEGCLLGGADYIATLAPDDEVQLLREKSTKHGMKGKKGNNRKDAAKDFLVKFVEANSAPSGLVPDADGNYTGAPNYLDKRFIILRKKKPDDSRVAFGDEVVDAMKLEPEFVANPKKLTTARTVIEWMTQLYGKTHVVDGKVVNNPKFTQLYPHR